MPDLDASGVLPFLLLGIRIIKEIYQILRQLRLLRFDGGKTISLHIHTHRHTTSFRVQGIGTDNASFHQRQVHERSNTYLIFAGCARRVASRRCRYGTHRGRRDVTCGCPSLSYPSVPSTVLPSSATCVNASSCFCACKQLGSLSHWSTARTAEECRRFSQQQHGQPQRQLRAFSFLPFSISHLLECMIQGGRSATSGFGYFWFSTFTYAQVHLRHFWLSIGAFLSFPK